MNPLLSRSFRLKVARSAVVVLGDGGRTFYRLFVLDRAEEALLSQLGLLPERLPGEVNVELRLTVAFEIPAIRAASV